MVMPFCNLFVGVALFSVIGCGSSSYQPATASRLTGVIQPTTAVSEAPDAAGTVRVDPPEILRLPARLGVVDVDDSFPATAVLDALRKHEEFFTSVEPIPGEMFEPHENNSDNGKTKTEAIDILTAIRRVAGGMGADYVLLYGRSVDLKHTVTPLQVFDWTILGAWIVPSEQLTADGRGGAMLIDVRTGRDIWNITAEKSSDTFLPTASASNAGESLQDATRQKLDAELTARAIGRISNEKGAGK